MTKVLTWLKWIGGAIIALGVIALIFYQMWGKNKKKGEIDHKIEKIKDIEHKTEQDRQELDRLTKESDELKGSIEETAKKYADALKKLEKKEDRPGDAGKAADDFNKVW